MDTVKSVDRVHQGDIIEVDVVGSFEFDWRGGLNADGYLDGLDRVPDAVFGRCRSTEELAGAITDAYRKVLRDPVVEVRILDRNGRSLAYLDGAVRTPMKVRIKRDVRLNELIVIAGGFADVVGNEISVFRPDGASCEGVSTAAVPEGPRSRVIKIEDILAGLEGTNPAILPGDIVTVASSLPVYVIGGVGNPQRLSARPGITLMRAVDASGGVAKNGRADSVTLYRRTGAATKILSYDLEKIRAGLASDPVIEANDIIEVPQRGDPPRRFPPVIEFREAGTAQMPLRIIE